MKKSEQMEINAIVLEMVERFNNGFKEVEPVRQLRSCSACVHTVVLEETGEVCYVFAVLQHACCNYLWQCDI